MQPSGMLTYLSVPEWVTESKSKLYCGRAADTVTKAAKTTKNFCNSLTKFIDLTSKCAQFKADAS